MAPFCRGVPRVVVLAVAIVAFCALPPEFFAAGLRLCLWRYLWHVSACPACGSTRALAAFFHGHLAQALAFNRNVIVTGPLLLTLLVHDLVLSARKWIM